MPVITTIKEEQRAAAERVWRWRTRGRGGAARGGRAQSLAALGIDDDAACIELIVYPAHAVGLAPMRGKSTVLVVDLCTVQQVII
jgi:hypothetical protein